MTPLVGAAGALGLGLLDKLAENPAGLARQSLQAVCVLAVGGAVILGYRGYHLEATGNLPPPTYYAGSESGFTGSPGGSTSNAGSGSAQLTNNETIHSINVKAGWPKGQLEKADAVVYRESGGRADAQNNWDSNAAAGTPSIGLWQIIITTARSVDSSATEEKLRNPLYNAQIALKVWRKMGWGPWAAASGWQAGRGHGGQKVTGYHV